MFRDYAWLTPLGVLWAAMVARFWFVCDDAFITWRYSANWAAGHGIRYNLGDEIPVEGYSNFLWLVVAAVFEVLGIDLTVAMPLVSAACGLALLVAVWRTGRVHFGLSLPGRFAGVATLALSMPFAVWSTSGLATMPFALLVFLLFERTALARAPWWQTAVTGLALGLIRTEGIAWVAVIAVLASMVAWRERKEDDPAPIRRLGFALAAIAALYAAYFAWRYAHFQTLVSNTALVKVSFSDQTLVRGLQYLGLYHLVFLVPLATYPGAWPVIRTHGMRGVVTSLMAVAFPAYAVVVGGDYMVAGRLFVPGLAFGALLFGALFDALADRLPVWGVALGALAVACLGLPPVMGLQPAAPASVHRQLHVRLNTNKLRSELEQWTYMSRNAQRWRRQGEAIGQVAPPGATMEHSTIGAVGYYSGVYIYDRAGLVTREVAEREIGDRPLQKSPGHDKTVPRYYFAKYDPTYLRAVRVQGWGYKGSMNRQVRAWRVPRGLQDRYVPDFAEIEADAATPAFLLTLRHLEPGEDAGSLWASFSNRLKTHELQYVEEEIPKKRRGGR